MSILARLTEYSSRLLLWKGAAAFVAILVASLLAAKAAEVTWHLAGYVDSDVETRPVPSRTVQNDPVDFDAIVSLAPFGRQVVADSVEPARETTLGLVLQGVVASGSPERSIAMIRAQGATVEPYNTGDRVPGGAMLDSIHADHVVLIVAGKREKLSFPDKLEQSSRSSGGVGAMRARLSPSARGTAGKIGPSRDTAFAAAARKPVPETDQSSLKADQVIDSFRKQIAANPKIVLDNLGVSVGEDGYRITENASKNVRLAGFKPGDVITNVNGKGVGSIDNDKALFEEVVASGRARVVVMRDGKRITMSFPLQ